MTGTDDRPRRLAEFGELPGEEEQYPLSFCERHRAVLLREGTPGADPPGKGLPGKGPPGAGALVGVAAPVPSYVEERLRRLHGGPVTVVPLAPQDVYQFLAERRLHREDARRQRRVARRSAAVRDGAGPGPRSLGLTANDARGGEVTVGGAGEAFLQGILDEAVRTGASDAHLMAGSAGVSLRFRREGALGEARAVPRELTARLVARLKVRIRGNPGQRRKPQEGRFGFTVRGTVYEVRASILPGLHGESVSLRFLRTFKGGISLDGLGFPGRIVTLLNGVAERTDGLFLVTGPTGSGKTTTLHAVARLLCRRDRRVVTIEDPIEYELPEAVQLQTNARLHLTFDLLLTKALRHDPDVLLLGEIRDAETAALAVRSALTGHLVLATMHTGTVFTGILRLRNLGATSDEVASALCGVLSQRLVRRVGISPVGASPVGASPVGVPPVGDTRQASADGRIPICEALIDPTDPTNFAPAGRFVEAVGRDWLYLDMKDDARRLVSAGVTTWEDVARVARIGGV